MTDKTEAPEPIDALEDTSTADRSGGDSGSNPLLNGLIGGIVGIIMSFLPFSTVLGGGVAGYLQDGDYASGAKVGAIAGVVTFIPVALIITTVLVFVPVVAVPDLGVQLALWMTLFFIVFFAAVYAIGLSILGGILGVYLNEEI